MVIQFQRSASVKPPQSLAGRTRIKSSRSPFPCALTGHKRRQLGVLTTELLVAMALLTAALLPLAYAFASEKRLARSYYQHAAAMEIVDGEMEILAAGEWRSFDPGPHDYTVRGGSLTNLPPGRFVLTVTKDKLRLEWQPALKMQGGSVVREATIR